jgi:hypothetical protein
MLTDIKFAALLLAFVMFIGGMVLIFLRSRSGNAPWVNHAFGIVLLIPAVMALELTGTVSRDIVAVLLGGLAGYIFGRSSRD